MIFEFVYLVWEKEVLRHEVEVHWEEALQSTQYDAKYVLLREVVHQRVPIEDTLRVVFDCFQVLISQSCSIPNDVTVTRVIGYLSESVFAYHVLEGVEFTAAVTRVNEYVSISFVPFLCSFLRQNLLW